MFSYFIFVYFRDAAGMAKDVTNALEQILMEAGGLSEADARTTIKQWRDQKRYLQDIWG